jgi:hypothetical protein
MDEFDTVIAQIDSRRRPAEGFAPEPLNYQRLISDGIPSTEYVQPPYLSAGVSAWGVGPSASGKSMWSAAVSCELSRRGERVIYISQENPLQVDLARLAKLRPDPRFLVLYHYQGFDFAIPEHVERLIEIAQGARLMVADTFSAVWSGDENDNAAVVGYDREVVRPLIAATGATMLTLDHTGRPQAFVRRGGVSAPRGASAKGQKADVLLEFRSEAEHEFSITHGKNRIDGTLEPKRQFRITDDEDDDTITLVPIETSADAKAREVADAMVEFVRAAEGPVSSTSLRNAMTGVGGRDAQTEAMRLLEAEDPPRLLTGKQMIETTAGNRRAKAWWTA